jgi:hypothetical protein
MLGRASASWSLIFVPLDNLAGQFGVLEIRQICQRLQSRFRGWELSVDAAGSLDFRLSMGGTMSGPIGEDRSEFGVLFVAGFAEQRPGAAIASFAGAVYRWLFRWNARPHPSSASRPSLSHTVLAGAPDADGGPAHVRLTVPVDLSSGVRDARWLLAESSWAGLFYSAAVWTYTRHTRNT